MQDTPLDVVFPSLATLKNLFGGKKKVEEDYEEMEIAPEKAMLKKDPYLLYGFGIVSYFDFLQSMMMLFLILTVLAIP